MRKNSKEEKEKKKEIIKTTLDVLPVRFYDEGIGSFILDDNSYMDIFEIIPKDRHNMQPDELKFEIYNLAKFYKLYAPDLKQISLNFPVNTSRQREVLKRAVRKTADEVRKVWLEREIRELEKLDNNVNRREFFLFFYGKNKEDFLKNRECIINWTSSGRSKFVREISKEKKIQIVRKMCNMSTLILPDELEERWHDEESI